MSASAIQSRLRSLGSPEAAANAARFFKTGPGEYGEGDIFLGITTPVLRGIAREHRDLPLEDVATLLRSEIHEDRMLALMIMVLVVAKADAATHRRAYELYLGHTAFINNWDLVDASARDIVGAYLAERSRKPLYRLARSSSLWERRISIVATHHFIRSGDYADTFAIAEHLLADPHDLIHKATGWMLREVGKKDETALEAFLTKHGPAMPRTMLRYAIERFAEERRLFHLKGSQPA